MSQIEASIWRRYWRQHVTLASTHAVKVAPPPSETGATMMPVPLTLVPNWHRMAPAKEGHWRRLMPRCMVIFEVELTIWAFEPRKFTVQYAVFKEYCLLTLREVKPKAQKFDCRHTGANWRHGATGASFTLPVKVFILRKSLISPQVTSLVEVPHRQNYTSETCQKQRDPNTPATMQGKNAPQLGTNRYNFSFSLTVTTTTKLPQIAHIHKPSCFKSLAHQAKLF
ncbi:hypothetical protein FB451DRAFT_1366125 [Mycena latifolia]|nr:hypothetical protein FB451DRAFT_1366125 [Mycena latifolia]